MNHELAIQTEKRTDLFKLDPRVILITGENPRFDYGTEAEKEAFKQSIKENGVKVPISVYREDGKFYLINGERRVRACLELISEGHPITVKAQVTRKPSLENLLIEMYISNDGKPFTVIEEMKFINRLFYMGLTGDDIATKIGKTSAHVSNMKKLSTIPDNLKEMIENKNVAATLVLNMLKEKNEDGTTMTVEDVTNVISQATITSKGKITKSSIDKVRQKYNSVRLLRTLLTDNNKTHFTEDNHDLVKFLRDVVNGRVSEQKIKDFLGFIEPEI